MSITKNKRTGRYQSRFRDSTGQQQQFTAAKYFPQGISKNEAQKLELAIIDEIENEIENATTPSLENLVDEWLDNHAIYLSGPKEYISHVNCIREYLVDKKITDVVVVANTIIKEGKKKGWANSTLSQRLNPLKQVAKIAFNNELIDINLGPRIPTLKGKVCLDIYLTFDEIDQLASEAVNIPTHYGKQYFSNLILFFAHTGIRLNEALRIEEGDIFAGRITIKGKCVGPNNKLRSFSLSEKGLQAAKEIEFPIKASKSTITGWMNRLKNESKLELIGWHTLRHSFASTLLQSGECSIHELQYLMGHTTITQTMKYAHLVPEKMNVGAGILNNLKPVKNHPKITQNV